MALCALFAKWTSLLTFTLEFRYGLVSGLLFDSMVLTKGAWEEGILLEHAYNCGA